MAYFGGKIGNVDYLKYNIISVHKSWRNIWMFLVIVEAMQNVAWRGGGALGPDLACGGIGHGQFGKEI